MSLEFRDVHRQVNGRNFMYLMYHETENVFLYFFLFHLCTSDAKVRWIRLNSN